MSMLTLESTNELVQVYSIGVAAQLTLGEQDIFARKICLKNKKMPEFYIP